MGEGNVMLVQLAAHIFENHFSDKNFNVFNIQKKMRQMLNGLMLARIKIRLVQTPCHATYPFQSVIQNRVGFVIFCPQAKDDRRFCR